MSVFSEAGDKLGIAGELLSYMWRMKMWWAIPMVSVLLLLGILIVMGSTSGVGPFVYTLFQGLYRVRLEQAVVDAAI